MISDMKCDIKRIVNLISITEISRSQIDLSFFIIGIGDFKIFKYFKIKINKYILLYEIPVLMLISRLKSTNTFFFMKYPYCTQS